MDTEISSLKHILVYVMNVPPGVRKSVDAYNELHATGYKIMQLWDSRVKDVAGKLNDPQVDIVVKCNFANDDAITEALVPYRDQLLAITCRQEQSLARFTRIIPHVPYLPAPTTESITWAADKYLMRKRFQSYDPSITPPFALIKKNSKADRKAVIDQVGFPMIVKPTNMVASLFVKICYHEEELEQATRYILRKLKVAYEADNRLEEPQIIAESYMDGDMYSVDSYVDMQGTITHCPLVRVRTGRDIGHDDFYNYLQVTPSALKDATVEKARHAAEQAIRALGLRSSLAHVELMKIDDEWKVIEVGARMGGFRHLLHKLSCGIDHSMNDILVRIPQKPIVPEKCTGYACAMKWFAAREGKITEMKGIKKIEELESFHSIAMNKKIGDRAVFSKNGGRSVFNLFMHNADRAKLLADIRRVEQLVEVKVARRKKPVKPVSTDAAPVVAKSTNMTNQATPKKKGAASAGTATKKPAKTKS